MINSGKHKLLSAFFWTAAVTAAVAVSVFFRLYPLTVFPQNAAKNKAEVLVYSNIRKTIAKYVQARHPQVSPSELTDLKNTAFQKFLAEQKLKVGALVQKTAEKIGENEKTSKIAAYLMEVDPYYYLSLTERLIEKGSSSFPVRGREYFNEKMMAPNGGWYPLDYHPYTGYLVYELSRIFLKNIPLEAAVAAVPLLLAALCLAPFFLISSKIFSLDAAPSFVGAVYLLLSPVYLRRSLWGWYDTDSYNVFFPLLILFFIFLSLKTTGSKRKNILWLVGAAMACAVYSLFWRGWLLEHALFCGALLFSLTASLLWRPLRDKAKEAMAASSIYILGPILLTPLLWGWPGFTSLLKEASELVHGFYLPAFNVWPDVFLTVGELKSSNFLSLVGSLGGMPALILFLTGIVLTLTDPLKNGALKISTLIIAFLFLLSSLVGASLERFELLAVAPMAVGVVLGIGQILSRIKNSNRLPGALLKTVLCASILSYILWQGHLTARYEHPIYNASWERMMSFLRNSTPEDSIVTSWWSPGHFITAKGKRRVTFDGATQNTPQAYWVANLFLDYSEESAAATLRMLNLSGNKALEFLTAKKIKLSEVVSLLHRVLPLPKEKALEELKKVLSSAEAAQVLDYTHGARQLPPSYVFIYNNMVEQAMALEYIGKWNFSKAENFSEALHKNPAGISRNALNRSSREHVLLEWSLSQGPYAQEDEAYEAGKTDKTVYFTNGLSVNLALMNADLVSKKFGKGKPRNIYFLNGEKLVKKPVEGGNLAISALLLRDEFLTASGEIKTSYRSVLADERLIESLLFKLYYLKGQGLRHFQLIASEENAANRVKIYIFRVLPD